MTAEVEIDPSFNKVQVTFALLNQGDFISFAVLSAGSPIDQFDAEVRIVGVPELTIVRNIQSVAEVARTVSWVVYPVGLFSLFSLALTVYGLSEMALEYRVKRMTKSGNLSIPTGGSKEAFLSFVDTKLSWTTEKERKPLTDMISGLPDDKAISPDKQDEIKETTLNIIEAATPNLIVVIIFGAICLIGIWFIVQQYL